ncbi:Protein kinase domain containing protein [Apiospora hydei]|uniref:Protein kinase domain containing protein n=1 Tax=Apiospora hydei TaxID=1337664 RepID=A0ABR1WXJ9_9PEZI
MATLRAQTTSCLELFASLAKLLENGPADHRNNLPVPQVEDQAARLKVWAGNLGALNTGHSALDHRLRDSTAIRNAIVRILGMAEDLLKISCLIVKGDRVPMEDAIGDCTDIDEQNDTDSDDSGSTIIDNELSFNLGRVDDLLSELHRLSFRIRNPSTRATVESTLKAQLHRERDPHTGEDVFEQYEKEDHLRVKGLVADFHLQGGHKLDHASDYLIKRASIANTNRRRCFSYWKAHASKLAKVSGKPQGSMLKLRPEGESAPHTETPPLETPVPSAVPKTVVSEQKTATSATEATIFAPNLDGQAWRKHILQDFQPYICTYKECPEDTALYADRIAWREHERLVHRRVWHCIEHPGIQRLLDMTISDQPDERSTCLFCGSEGPFEVDFTDHVASHMEKFAMLTSPLDYEGDGNPHGSGSGVAMSGGADSRLSLSSLSSFDSSAGGSEYEDSPSLNTFADREAESQVMAEFEHEMKRCTRFSVIAEKPFLLDQRLLYWFRNPDISGTMTNAGRILRALPGSLADIIPVLEEHMGKDDERLWLRIFAVLLQLGNGSYIKSFWLFDTLDSQLPVTEAQLQNIWDAEEATSDESLRLTERFLKLQYQLCTSISGNISTLATMTTRFYRSR